MDANPYKLLAERLDALPNGFPSTDDYQRDVPGKNSVPGAVIALQTFGDFLGFNPHGHVLVTDGCFPEKGLFKVALTV